MFFPEGDFCTPKVTYSLLSKGNTTFHLDGDLILTAWFPTKAVAGAW